MKRVEKQPLISIIIPVYNVEKYLPACLDSVLAQTYRNLEVILVDDGSPDGSGAVCDAYAAKDSRIRVIHQENGGASAARNAGLDLASGSFIGFIDPDDYIEPDMYEILYEQLQSSGADVAQCGYVWEEEGKEDVFFHNSGEVKLYNGPYCIQELLTVEKPWWAVWNKLYRSKLFQELRFNEDLRVGEDIFFTFQIFLQMKQLISIKRPLYHYICRPFSLAKFNLHYIDHLKIGRRMIDCLSQSGSELTGCACRWQAIHLINLYDSFLLDHAFVRYPEMRREFLGEMKRSRFQILKTRECERNYKIKLYIISTAPRLYGFLFPLWLKAKKCLSH